MVEAWSVACGVSGGLRGWFVGQMADLSGFFLVYCTSLLVANGESFWTCNRTDLDWI